MVLKWLIGYVLYTLLATVFIMAEYKYGKWKTWEGYEYFAIHKKTFFGWKEQKTWGLGYAFFNDFTKEDVKRQRQKMMDTVDRLVKAGHTVL